MHVDLGEHEAHAVLFLCWLLSQRDGRREKRDPIMNSKFLPGEMKPEVEF